MWIDNASDVDLLFYKPYASVISDIVINNNYEPLTIGIFGIWGAGKSSLLNLVKNEISDTNRLVCIELNAWIFEGYEDAKVALMEALIKQLDIKEPFKKNKSKIKRLLRRIDLLKLGSSVVANSIPILASIGSNNPDALIALPPQMLTSLAKCFDSNLKNSEGLSESLVENISNFRKEFETLIEESETKVVILIDDLDRCVPERIIETLEAIKLFLSVKNTSFIIAADEQVIQYAIKNKYPLLSTSEVDLSKEYIEKMIQIPIYLPDLSSKDIENYLLLLVVQKYVEPSEFQGIIEKVTDEKLILKSNRISIENFYSMFSNLSITPSSEFKEIAEIIFDISDIVSETLKGNPRQAKRFLNTFITKRSLSKVYYGEELDMRILAKILVLQKIEPSLFRKLNEWNKSFELINDKFKETYDILHENSSSEKELAQWKTLSMKKWIDCNPKNLYDFNLDKYFYLTREHLNKTDNFSKKLSDKSKSVLENIKVAKRGNISGYLKILEDLTEPEIEDVFCVLLHGIEKKQLDFFITSEVFIQFKSYREKISTSLKKGKYKVSPADSIYLKKMYINDAIIVSDYIEYLSQNNLVSKKLKETILSETGVR